MNCRSVCDVFLFCLLKGDQGKAGSKGEIGAPGHRVSVRARPTPPPPPLFAFKRVCFYEWRRSVSDIGFVLGARYQIAQVVKQLQNDFK